MITEKYALDVFVSSRADARVSKELFRSFRSELLREISNEMKFCMEDLGEQLRALGYQVEPVDEEFSNSRTCFDFRSPKLSLVFAVDVLIDVDFSPPQSLAFGSGQI